MPSEKFMVLALFDVIDDVNEDIVEAHIATGHALYLLNANKVPLLITSVAQYKRRGANTYIGALREITATAGK